MNLNIGGSNLTNASYGNIGDQVKFIDTIKFYQQSLEKITFEFKRFLQKYQYFKNIFNFLNEEDQNWILNYLPSGKGVVPYEKIKSCKSLNLKLDGESFNMIAFYSSLKNKIITDKECIDVKKLF